MLQHTGLNKASRITVLSSEFSHYLYNVTKEYMNASVHELFIKVVLKNTVLQIEACCSGNNIRNTHTQINHTRLWPLLANLYGLATE